MAIKRGDMNHYIGSGTAPVSPPRKAASPLPQDAHGDAWPASRPRPLAPCCRACIQVPIGSSVGIWLSPVCVDCSCIQASERHVVVIACGVALKAMCFLHLSFDNWRGTVHLCPAKGPTSTGLGQKEKGPTTMRYSLPPWWRRPAWARRSRRYWTTRDLSPGSPAPGQSEQQKRQG